MTTKMFVVIRNDTETSPIAQACHAVSQYLIDYSDRKGWRNGTVVVLQASEDRFMDLIVELELARASYSFFEEPDIGNEITALSCIGHDELFKRFELVNAPLA